MAVAMIGPKFYAWDRNGKPLAFGKLYTYQARTNDPKDTYQSEDQVVPNTNPVILNGEGYADVYLSGSYKMVLKDKDDNEIWSSDPVSSAQPSEWVNCLSATYLSSTSFKINGNFVVEYEPGRRVRIDNNASEYSYATIRTSVFAAGETTVTIDDPAITTGLVETCVSIVGPESRTTDEVLNLATLQEAVESIFIKEGDALNVKERSSGNGGGAMWDAVLSSSVTPNNIDIVQCSGVPTLALVLRTVEGFEVDIKALGAVGDNLTDNSDVLEYAFSLGRVIRVSRGNFKFSRSLSVSKYTSIEGAVGANLIADFSNNATWNSDFVALRFEGLGGVDVTPTDFNTTFKDIVLTSVSANTVEAIGVEVPNGATSSSILEARTFCDWNNIMVIGFDTAYRLGQLRESVLTNLKCRDVRVGIDVNGKTVNVALNSLNLFQGTPQTTNINTTKGIIFDSFFRSAVEERPEGVIVSCGSLIAAFDVNVQYIRGLSMAVVDSIIDLARGVASVQIGACRGFTLENNWIATQVAEPVIILDAVSVPDDEVLCQISNNTINGGTNGISFGASRRSILIQGNEFASQTSTTINLSNAVDIDVLNNKAKVQSGTMINITSCGDLNIDGNTTDADIVINMHPTANTKGGINIGKNYGAVQRTWFAGVVQIPSGQSSVSVPSDLDIINYVIPSVNIHYIESTVNTTLVGSSSYNSPSSSIKLSSSVVAPAGGHNIHYELKGLWYGDRN